jgi:hypothetical protein
VPTAHTCRETLLKLADAAMYRSKMRKKGTVSAGFADLGVPTGNPEADRLDRRLLMSAELEGADSDDWSTKTLATHGPLSVPAIAPRVATMRAAAIPKNEVDRLIALYSLGLLDAPGFETLDHVTRMVTKSLDVPFALISLVDDKRQWFLSRQGLEVDETPREIAFCAHVVFDGHPLIVPDATEDERFAGNPLVTGGPHIRAYAGIPISSQSGHVLGTLCAIDVRPRHFSDDAISTLQGFATVVEELIQGRVARARTGVLS